MNKLQGLEELPPRRDLFAQIHAPGCTLECAHCICKAALTEGEVISWDVRELASSFSLMGLGDESPRSETPGKRYWREQTTVAYASW